MHRTNKIAIAAFIGGWLSPLVAIIIKPTHYAFYMAFPAMPDSVADQSLLFAANAILLAGFLITAIASVILTINGWRQRKYVYFIFPILLLVNPIHQCIYLEPLDTYINYRWRDRALEHNIIGKTPDEVKKLFGEPSRVWTGTSHVTDKNGNETLPLKTYTGWNYHVIPFYLIGSKFEVFFVNGTVTYFEANDD